MRASEAADTVRSNILNWVEGAGRTAKQPLDWVVRGEARSGKSHFLARLVQDIAKETTAKPILVAPPVASQDSAGAALVQIGEQLRSHGVINGECSLLSEQLPWRDKLDKVGQWLENNASELVIICDDPDDWAPSSCQDGYSPRHVAAVKSLIGQTTGLRRIISGSEGLNSRQFSQGRLDPLSATRAVFTSPTMDSEWGRLTPIAREIQQKVLTYMPLDARLLVAIRVLAPNEFARQINVRRRTNELLSVLDRHLQTQRSGLPAVWRRVALLRRSFQADALDCVGIEELSEDERCVLFHCLLDRRGSEYSMHRNLCIYARDHFRLPDDQINQCHKKIALYFANRRATNQDTLLSDSVEAYHHGLEGGALNNVQPMFTDQLNMRGQMLSLQGEHDKAAELFYQSIQWDNDDDYAHHYYAYNLDYVGSKSDEVDNHYEIATEIDPRNTWWWSRRINFLITMGRMAEVKAVWEDARTHFESRQDADYYNGLHKWITRLLIELGQLDFAEDILNGVQEPHLKQAPFRALRDYLVSARQAQRRRAVYPLGISHEEWWIRPHLHNAVNDVGQHLVRWYPGRVDECDNDNVRITIATPPAVTDAEPVYSLLFMKREVFENAWKKEEGDSLAAGRYVELAYFQEKSDKENLIIRAHPDEEWDEKDLPDIDPPDTARYLRQGGLLT